MFCNFYVLKGKNTQEKILLIKLEGYGHVGRRGAHFKNSTQVSQNIPGNCGTALQTNVRENIGRLHPSNLSSKSYCPVS